MGILFEEPCIFYYFDKSEFSLSKRRKCKLLADKDRGIVEEKWFNEYCKKDNKYYARSCPVYQAYKK